MVDLAGIGACLTGAGTLITAVRIHKQLKMGNGHTIGEAVEDTHRMTVNAEPHHEFIPTESGHE